MTLEFLPKALMSFRELKENRPETAERIKALLKDVLEHPDSGAGSPIQLGGKYAGVWMRRISFEDTLYYVFNPEKVVVLSISLPSLRVDNSRKSSPGTGKLVVEAFSEEDYASVMALMQANRGKNHLL